MFQHFLRYVREENGCLFLQHPRRRANAQEFGSSLDRGCIRISVEREHLQTLSIIAQDAEFGSVQPRTVGQNVTQAVQNGFDRGLLSDRTGHIEQRSVSAIDFRWSLGILAPHAHENSTTGGDFQRARLLPNRFAIQARCP
jgi:hypothetical protein